MPTPDLDSKWTVYLDARLREALERRGARSDPKHGPAGKSSILRRRLNMLNELLEVSDPRETHGLPEAYFRLALRLLPDAHLLPPGIAKTLDAHFAVLRALPAAAVEEGVEPRKFVKAIAALPYAQRFFLVDFAEQENARSDADEPPDARPVALSRPRRSRR